MKKNRSAFFMKKIFLIMLIIVFFSPLINAYEYMVYDNPDALNDEVLIQFYTDSNNTLQLKRVKANGDIIYTDFKSYVYGSLNSIKRQPIQHSKFINPNTFKSYYTNDLIFLNDLYSNINWCNAFLNYLYNDSSFGSANYIEYIDYQLLYDKNGLAVESIVNGVWAGLYSDDEKQFSGKLYGADGGLMYNNGEEVNYIQILLQRLLSKFDTTLVGVFWIMGSVAGFGFIAYCVIDTLIFILNIGVNVFTGLKYGKVNWW